MLTGGDFVVALYYKDAEEAKKAYDEYKASKDEEDGHMILELQDNGKGFEMTQTDLNPHKDRKKIGVANVNDRIHLNFGRKYGLKINSHPGEGTTCTLTLPELYADTLSQHPEE